VEPAVVEHMVPLQQSAVVVHAPPLGTHSVRPQTNGGVPAGFGTHGRLQQSALVAQAVPAAGAPFEQSWSDSTVQRGIPSRSSAQSNGCCCTVPEQHRSVALHEVLARRQIAPAGLHEWPLSQAPTAAPGAFAQWTSVGCPDPPCSFVEPGEPSAPQQSLSV